MFRDCSRLLRCIILLGLSLWPLGACQTPAAAPSPASESSLKQAQRGFLWEARRGSQVLTLIGTMHVGIKEADIPPVLWQRLAEAETVIVECDLSTLSPTLARRYLQLPAGQSLEQMLGPQDWQRLWQWIHGAFPQLSAAELSRLSPAAATTQLMLAQARMAQIRAGKPEDAGQSMDQVIWERAVDKNRRVMESIEEQLEALQTAFTLEQLREQLNDASQNEFEDLEQAYRGGRGEQIEALIAEMPEALRRILLDGRNLKWAQRLPTLIAPKRTIIAVGAAHFGGENSLLLLLEQQGFQIRSLSF